MDDEIAINICHFEADRSAARELYRGLSRFLPRHLIHSGLIRDDTPWGKLAEDGWVVILVSPLSVEDFLSAKLFRYVRKGLLSKNLLVLVDQDALPDLPPSIPYTLMAADFATSDLGINLFEFMMDVTHPGPPPDNRGESAYDVENHLVVPVDGDRYVQNPVLTSTLGEINITKRVSNLLMSQQHIVYVGDLVQRTEVDILRTPGLGRESLRDIKEALRRHKLRLGLDLTHHWPPANIEAARTLSSIARRVLKIGQAPLGATFEPDSELLRINAAGSESDFEAAEKPLVRQLHPEIVRKAARFQSVAPRLDNQIGWTGISALSERLYGLVNRGTAEVPEVLGTLYSAALELGSFLEMDRKIAAGESSFAPPLDVEVSRPLEDLLRSLAPWLRSFPSVREMDNEAGRFLTRDPLLKPSSSVVDAALVTELIISEDAAALHALIDASDRGEFQGIKAGHRGVLSVRNMIVAATSAISLFLLSAVESDFATKSILVQKAGTFLAKAESPILEVLASLPQDLRLAVEAMIREARDSPPIPSRQPVPRTPSESERVRRRR